MLSVTVYSKSVATVSHGCCGKCVVEKGVNAYDLFSVPPRSARGQKELRPERAFETVVKSY